MKLFRASFWLQLKRGLFTRWSLLLLLLLALILTGLAGLSRIEEPVVDLSAGVAFDPKDEFAQQVMERLESLTMVQFHRLGNASKEELEELVQTRQYQAVYQLPSNLQERVASGRLNKAVLSYQIPSSAFNSMMDKWIFATVMIQAVPDITAYELSQLLGLPAAQLREELDDSLAWYQTNYNFVETEVSWDTQAGAAPIDSEIGTGWVRAAHGMIALLVLLFGAVSLNAQIYAWGKVALGLSPRQRLSFTLGSFLGVTGGAFALGSVGVLLTHLLPLGGRPLSTEFAALLAYSVVIAALSTLLSQLVTTGEGVLSGTIFLLLVVLVLGGVLFDPSEISRWLAGIARLFPTYYYQKAVVELQSGSLFPLGAAAAGALLGALVLALPTPKRRIPL